MMDNEAPTVYSVPADGAPPSEGGLRSIVDDDGATCDAVDAREVFELLRHLNDPEHPLTLEQLHVTTLEGIRVDDAAGTVEVSFTPTIPHCSMATLIGLCIHVKLLRGLPSRFKVRVRVAPGSHASEEAINKQLADKERVAAALENGQLLTEVNKCTAHTDRLDEAAVELLLA